MSLCWAPTDEDKCSYKHGTFLLTCDFLESYSLNPPEMRFVTFILHPNVSGTFAFIDITPTVHHSGLQARKDKLFHNIHTMHYECSKSHHFPSQALYCGIGKAMVI